MGRFHLMFAAMCLIWGATWIAIKAGITVVPPGFFAGTRFTVAGLVLMSFLVLRGEPLALRRADLPRWAAVTVLMIVATYALLFWGAQYVSSGLASILDMALTPIALLSLGAALGEDRFTWPRALGVAVGVAGLLVLFGPKAIVVPGEAQHLQMLACLAIVLSAVAYALGSVLARPLLRTYSPVLVSGITTAAGGCVLVAGALAFEPGAVAATSLDWGLAAWAGWLFLVLGGSLAGYTIYLHLIRQWGATRAGSFAFVSPVIAVVLGMLVFGETITAIDVLGMAAMLAGAWLTLRPLPEEAAA
jgi:drug/metabolite transporter (DMT)-like permease